MRLSSYYLQKSEIAVASRNHKTSKAMSDRNHVRFSIENLRFCACADTFNDEEAFVSISEMSLESFKPTMNDVVLAEILYFRRKKEDQPIFNKSRGEAKNLSFDRILMCRCLNSPPGLNVFAILLGQQRNNHFFHRHIEGR